MLNSNKIKVFNIKLKMLICLLAIDINFIKIQKNLF